MLVGVNGCGKTTSAGKLASHYKNSGMKVMLAACDTYRAAATEQLKIWGGYCGAFSRLRDKMKGKKNDE